ncbi:MFS transporter [Candidatus Woesearchaeota archaeon]|nr:MFS transporter [Candidatus Woesearchaeota archaeon]
MRDYFSRFRTPYLLLTCHTLIAALSFSFVPLFFRNQGYSLWFILLLYIIYTGTAVFSIPFLARIPIKRFLITGLVLFMVMLLVLAANPAYSFYIVAILLGLNAFLFWIPLNYLFFSASTTQTNAVDSSLYMSISTLLAAFIPPLGAFFIQRTGYSHLFFFAALLYLIPLYLLYQRVPEQHHEISFLPAVRNFKGLKTITLFEGSLQLFGGVVLPVYALLYLRTEMEFGLLLSYIGIAGFFVSLVLSFRSDKTQRRKKYVFLSFLLLTASIISLAFAHNVLQFLIAVGIFSMIATASYPLRLAVSLDAKQPTAEFWTMREFFFSLGRMITLSLAMLFLYLETYWAVFVLYGLMSAAYPFLVYRKLKMC